MIYAVRLSPGAEREVAEATVRIADIADREDAGIEWYVGLKETAASLSENPRRFQVQADDSRRIGQEVRRLLYQRTKSSTHAYHLYYSVEDQGEDGPRVTIIHVRHASRKPITRAEAKDILGGS
ncbi:MAG: hypothetical protein V4671_21710 [Armatimonadota bacterium]